MRPPYVRMRLDRSGRPWSRWLLRLAFEVYLLAVMALFASLAYVAAQGVAQALAGR